MSVRSSSAEDEPIPRDVVRIHPGQQHRGTAERSRRALAILAFAVAATVAVVPVAQAAAPTPRASSDVRLGIDVSSHQPNTDWAAVAGDNIRFAMVKATESTNYTNPLYASDRASANAHGIVVGAYAYAQPSGSTPDEAYTSGRKQAAYFLSVARPKAGDLLPVIDIEVTNGLGPNKLTAWLHGWISRVRGSIGMAPMIYVSPLFWEERLDNTAVFAQNGVSLWIANWQVSAPAVPAGNWAGHGYSLWQWTNNARVSGVQGRVDADQSVHADLGAVRIPLQPKPFKAPTVKGSLAVASQAGVSPGSWSGTTPITFTYQWQRCDGSGKNCRPIASATQSTHTITAADVWHTLRVKVVARNAAGQAGARSAASRRVPDSQPPSVPVLSQPRHAVQRHTALTVAWSAHDTGSGISHYALRRQVLRSDGTSGPWKVLGWSLKATRQSAAGLQPGSTYCFQVAAYDRAGNSSGWSATDCTTVPLDDTALAPHGGWTRSAASGVYQGTLSTTTTNGATLTSAPLTARRLGVLVETCPTCGKITVTWQGVAAGTYNLAAGALHRRVLIMLPAFSAAEQGRLVITAVSQGGRRVAVDGVAAIAG
jgi:GH25 family lysozyme M1 (1,4-beta-N-acetylmuramidase)